MERSIDKAVRLLGGPVKAAGALHIRHYQTIQRWQREGTVPADYCPTIERATSGAVRCEDLRPDVDWAYLRSTDCPAPPFIETSRAHLLGEHPQKEAA